MKTKNVRKLICSLSMALVLYLPIHVGCKKSETGVDSETIFEAEGYIIGHHPCAKATTVTISPGEGKGYLIATFSPSVDTLMIWGFTDNFLDIPENWYTMTGFFPSENQKEFKVGVSYQKSQENIGKQFPCPAFYHLRQLLRLVRTEYIVIKAERIE